MLGVGNFSKMKSIQIFITIFFLCSNLTSGQSIQNAINELKTQKIDTILVYRNYDNGAMPAIFDPTICEVDNNEVRFVFFKKNNVIKVQRIDNCFNYKTIKLDNFISFSILIDKINEFEDEVIKGVEKVKRNQIHSFTQSHDNVEEIEFYLKDKQITKSYTKHQMEMKRFNGTKNQNHSINNKTITKKVVDECKEAISKLAFQKI